MIDQCVILLGGLGTRLGELTRDVPKPLLPAGARPFIDVLVDEGLRRGFSRFVFLAGHRSEVVKEYAAHLRARLGSGKDVVVSVEPEPMGTGGALLHAAHLLDERFLLLNGDTWFDFNWRDLTALAEDGSVIAAREVPVAERYEALDVTGDSKVAAILPRGTVSSGTCRINAGVYCLWRKDLAGFEGAFSLESDLLPELVRRGALRAKVYPGYFIDIGIPETYLAAQSEVPMQLSRPGLFLDRDGVLNRDDAYVGSIDRFHWIEGAKQAVKYANDAGWYVFVVTNQAGVAKGFYSEADVRALHTWIAREINADGAHIDDFRYCPFHLEGVVDGYRAIHAWRKPQPGMILDLASQWPVDMSRSFLVGDQPSDMEAAAAAGIRGVRFGGGDIRDLVASMISEQMA